MTSSTNAVAAKLGIDDPTLGAQMRKLLTLPTNAPCLLVWLCDGPLSLGDLMTLATLAMKQPEDVTEDDAEEESAARAYERALVEYRKDTLRSSVMWDLGHLAGCGLVTYEDDDLLRLNDRYREAVEVWQSIRFSGDVYSARRFYSWVIS